MVGARVLCGHLGKFFVQEREIKDSVLVHCLLVWTYEGVCASFSFVASDSSEED